MQKLSTVISVKNLSKYYWQGQNFSWRNLISSGAKVSTPKLALTDLSFQIYKGECVAIIGANGAGKSTLLKILTGVSSFHEGEVIVDGNVASLLELGIGLHPELTGIENIYYYGRLLGKSSKEVKHYYNEIIQFSDLTEDDLKKRVKKFSSGMTVRLAFALSIFTNPDILIIDEALAVGDINFQAKCFNYFKKCKEEKKSILFVTHSLEQVMEYCDRLIILHHGTLYYDGPTKIGVDKYKILMSGEDPNSLQFVQNFQNQKDSIHYHLEYGTKEAIITNYLILNSKNIPSTKILSNESFSIQIKVKLEKKEFETKIAPIFAYTIKDLKGIEICGTNTSYLNLSSEIPASFFRGEEMTITFSHPSPLHLKGGGYALSLGITEMSSEGLKVYHRLYDVIIFEVISVESHVGLINPKPQVTYL